MSAQLDIGQLALARLQKARRALILDNVFFGVPAMKLRLEETTRTQTMATDGVGLYFNAAWVMQQTHAQLVGTVAHEVMHCLMQHHTRRGTRDPDQWNVAADHVINLPLLQSGFQLPEGVLADPQFTGMSAEQAYAKGRTQPQPQEGEAGEGEGTGEAEGESEGQGEGKGENAAPGQSGEAGGVSESDKPPVPGEVWDAPDPVTAEAEWKITAQQAAMAAQRFGNMPGFGWQMVKQANKPATDWRAILRRFVQQVAAADYSMRQPNRRYLASGVYLPALREPVMGPVVVVLDTSGSTYAYQSGFLAECQSIMEEVMPERVVLVECDTRVNRTTDFERGEPVATPDNQLRGQGGTDFRPPFTWVEQEGIQPACLIYLTDAEGPFPEYAPEYPVLWALTPPSGWARGQEGARVPWGESVELTPDL